MMRALRHVQEVVRIARVKGLTKDDWSGRAGRRNGSSLQS